MSRERLHQRQRRNFGRRARRAGVVFVFKFSAPTRELRRHRAMFDRFRRELERADREVARIILGSSL
jgi:hypothetical protein